MKVLQFVIGNPKGGITRYVLNNWYFIDKNKFKFDFVTMKKSKQEYEDELEQQGCKVYHMTCYAEENEQKFIEELSDIMKNYDVVHLHTSFWKSLAAERAAKFAGVEKIIIHSHNTGISRTDDPNELKKFQLMHDKIKQKLNVNIASDFCACSNAAADWLYGSQIPKNKIKIMKNAIDIKPFLFNQSVRDDYRRQLDLENCFVIGSVGRFTYQKNPEFLIKVFAKVSKQNDKARLLLVGDGNIKNDLIELAVSFNIENKVIFTGERNDVNCLLQAMDIFCLPSRFEGLPIVAVEAQTAGLKCLISDTVTNEVCITENVCRLPLDENIWSENILNYSYGYERGNMYDEITNAEYNIKYQIKEIEKLYLL